VYESAAVVERGMRSVGGDVGGGAIGLREAGSRPLVEAGDATWSAGRLTLAECSVGGDGGGGGAIDLRGLGRIPRFGLGGCDLVTWTPCPSGVFGWWRWWRG
jgi:hypothetical protein